MVIVGFPGGSVVKNPPANAGDAREEGSIRGLERSPGEGNGNSLQHSCLGNPMDRGAWWATIHQFSSLQSLSLVWLFATPWIAACQASLSITNSQSLPKLMSIESVMPSNHLLLCRPLLLPPSIFPSIRVFSNESVLQIRWPMYWSFSFSTSPSMNIQDWFPLRLTGWISLQSNGLSRVFSNTTVQKHQFLFAHFFCNFVCGNSRSFCCYWFWQAL